MVVSGATGCANAVLEVGPSGEIVGRSSALQRVLRQVEMVAATDASVLILGESGTDCARHASAAVNLSSYSFSPCITLNRKMSGRE